MPTSRGSNLWGDSPTVLLLREAEAASTLVTRLFPGSVDFVIPCRFFRCFVLSPLYLNLFPHTWHWKGLSPVCRL